jgi:hypothetical protein
MLPCVCDIVRKRVHTGRAAGDVVPKMTERERDTAPVHRRRRAATRGDQNARKKKRFDGVTCEPY